LLFWHPIVWMWSNSTRTNTDLSWKLSETNRNKSFNKQKKLAQTAVVNDSNSEKFAANLGQLLHQKVPLFLLDHDPTSTVGQQPFRVTRRLLQRSNNLFTISNIHAGWAKKVSLTTDIYKNNSRLHRSPTETRATLNNLSDYRALNLLNTLVAKVLNSWICDRTIYTVSVWKTKSWFKKQMYMKTETCKLYSRVFSTFLPNFIKIDPYNFEQYRFKVCTFFETPCI